MLKNRINLDEHFETLLGNENVYFQPPPSVAMSYPAIVYHLTTLDTAYASDSRYKVTDEYQITLIDWSPESTYVNEILKLPYCKLKHTFTSNNLNHFVFTLYY